MPDKVRRRKTRAELIADLERLGGKLGRTPTSVDLAAACKARTCAYVGADVEEFGSFNAAVQAAGFTPDMVVGKLGRDELVAELFALREGLGRPPKVEDVRAADRDAGGSSPSSDLTEFGTFRAALRAVGIDSRCRPRGRDELIADLVRLAKKLGRTPRVVDLEAASKAQESGSMTLYRREFGSFCKALDAAGSNRTRGGRSREQMLADLIGLRHALDRVPSGEDVPAAARTGTCVSLDR